MYNDNYHALQAANTFTNTGNPRVTPEVTRDVCLLARMMAANLYCAQIEDLMFEVKIASLLLIKIHLYWINGN